MKILVINCGSSSLKFQLIDSNTEEVLAKGLCERIGIDGSQLVYKPLIGNRCGDKIVKPQIMDDHTEAIKLVLDSLIDSEIGVISSLSQIDAVGHRIVHGGEKFTKATIIDEQVLNAIQECSELAPLHNPANLIGIEACKKLMYDTPMVAVFDTAFHQTMPEEAYLYGIPYEYYKKYKIRRYGFHGTSHSYVSKRAALLLGKTYDSMKIIVCHLGNGASISAVKNGVCIDTSMGLTPLEGLIMGTRSGDIDPAIIEYISHKENKNIDEIMSVLNKKSGVLGLSNNFSSDFRDLEDGYLSKHAESLRAMDSFIYRVVKYIGAYIAVMDGVDTICFTAGLGENSGLIRKLICNRLSYFGLQINDELNQTRGKEVIISTDESKITAIVIPTNEELAIARETASLI